MKLKYTKPEFVFLIACLITSFLLLFFIFQSFIGPFIFATIFSASLLPVHKKLIKFKYINSKLSALTLLLALTVLLIGPLGFIVINSVEEIVAITTTTTSINNNSSANNNSLLEKIYIVVNKYTANTIPIDFMKKQWDLVSQKIKNDALTYLNNMLNNVTEFLFNYIIFCLTIYVILTHGEGLKKIFHKLSLLPEKDEEIILKKIENLNRVLLIGNALGGMIQCLAIFILLSFTNIEKIFFWSLLVLICSFVPVFGASLIFVPLSAFLWFSNEKSMAITTLSIMSVFFVFVENWFKPKFIGGRIHMHSLIILFSMLGGVKFFGIGGIFYGPLITTIFFTIFEVFHLQIESDRKS